VAAEPARIFAKVKERHCMLESFEAKVKELGKPGWRPMLMYVARLHGKSTHKPEGPFKYPWEEIGPGYCYGPAFGHWDIVHAVLDEIPYEPEHARNQILNNLAAQQEDGLVPGSIWMREEPPRWNTNAGHPTLWQVAVQDYCDAAGSNELIEMCYEPLVRLAGWYENNRKAQGAGFYYTDILNNVWESGIDEGIRFKNIATGPYACVDATSHVYLLYEYAARWSLLLTGRDEEHFAEKAEELKGFIQNELFDPESGFFHDIWAIGKPENRHMAFEGMWPMAAGAATPEQAKRVVFENLLNPDCFFSSHPITTVGLKDTGFELRMWRGPAWNSMTYWAARGCINYGYTEAARLLLERALDASALQFDRTGTIWEFYHPFCGSPEEVQRKPHTRFNKPCRDYLGHNPLIAMAKLWESCGNINNQ
jgi:glycogen debranching enzyme